MMLASAASLPGLSVHALDIADAREILVRGPNWVGDLVMATPGFRALRAACPEARITLQVRQGLGELISGAPWFDEIRDVRSYHQGFASLISEATELRRTRHYDLGICIPESFSSALLQRIAGVERVAGFGGGLRDLLLRYRVRVPDEWGSRRMVARERFVLRLLEGIGVEEQGTGLELYVTAADEAEGARALAEVAIRESDPFVAMAPGASFGPAKRWPSQAYAQVADALIAAGLRVVLIGAGSEIEIAHEVMGAMEWEASNLVGRVSLGGAKSVVQRSSLMICNDAGARHIAVAFDVPCIVFFGPTSLAKTNLNLARVRVFETDHDCRPCYLRNCPIDHRCMTHIAPADVVAQARELVDAVA